MCRLLAWVSRTPTTARDVLGEQGLEALRRLSRLHADGWGAAVDLDGRLVVQRSTLRADADPDFTAATTQPTCAGLVHLRWATPGLPVQLSNTHPFVVGDRAFAHNGAIVPVERLGELLERPWRDRLQGTTDSEHYFLAVLAELEAPDTDLATAVDRATARIARELEPASLNAVLHDPEAVHVVNCHDPAAAPALAPPAGPGAVGEARLAQEEPYFDLRYRATDDSVVVASSGFVPAEAGWELLPNDHVLVVRRDTLALDLRPLSARLGRRSAA